MQKQRLVHGRCELGRSRCLDEAPLSLALALNSATLCDGCPESGTIDVDVTGEAVAQIVLDSGSIHLLDAAGNVLESETVCP